MSVKFAPTSTIELYLGINDGGRVNKFAVDVCAKHMDKYVPFDTGATANTITKTNKQVIYNTPYALKIYNGDDMEFHKDKHPLATAHWDKKMWSAEKNEVYKEIQNFIGR